MATDRIYGASPFPALSSAEAVAEVDSNSSIVLLAAFNDPLQCKASGQQATRLVGTGTFGIGHHRNTKRRMTDVTPPEPLRARFNPLIRPYLVLQVALFLAATVVCIPLAVIWVLGVGQWWARHYFDKLECELGPKLLRYRKGILFQIEKTIPLENIQDVTFVEGPLLKHFNLSILKFETAGQSQGQAHDMRLIGIIDAHEFRDRILAQREALKHGREPEQTSPSSAASEETVVLLRRILERLDAIAAR
ncbi:MAG: PH domain-containing protein [Flavobacteriales bacterium]|jgi:putative membrane protein|nr:PH domain-containing protein [Flavobacteriales bacterium]MBK9699801.1 PH domain-containing protein [Flavobacteriales bacterium]